MKAIVCTKTSFPDTVVLKEVNTPIPGDDEVLVEIHASSVTFSNRLAVDRKFFPLRLIFGKALMPASGIPGTDIAGKVTVAGKNITGFKPGDRVYGDLFNCGKGGYAEYACVPENALALMPAGLSYEQTAALPEQVIVALLGLRDMAKIKKGQQVLVYSASGGIGTITVQIAKYYGAEVTGVCGPGNLELVHSLGADEVIDYTKEDFSKHARQYDVIFAARKTLPVKVIRRVLKPGGIYVSVGGTSPARLFQEMISGPKSFKKEGKRIGVIDATKNVNIPKELEFACKLVESGKLKPVIDKIFPLEATADAFRYYTKGHARGKVIISIRKD